MTVFSPLNHFLFTGWQAETQGAFSVHPFTIPDSEVTSSQQLLDSAWCGKAHQHKCVTARQGGQQGGWLLTQITSAKKQELNRCLCFTLPAFSKRLASSFENVQKQQQQLTFACSLSGSCCSEHIMYVNLFHFQGNSKPRYYLLKSPLWREAASRDMEFRNNCRWPRGPLCLSVVCIGGACVCPLPSPSAS